MKKWNSWRSGEFNNNYDVIIIGSGISGLTAGVLLAREGKKVLVLEKHFKIGGWTHTFKRKKYEWDVGIHYIGEVHNKNNIVYKLFDYICNGKLKWNKMNDNYDKIIFPDKEYNFNAPRSRFISDMLQYFPGTEQKFIKYINMIDESVKSGQQFYANKALPRWLGNMTYSFMTKKYFKYSDLTTRNVIMELFDNEKILGVLSGQWGDHGLPPSQSSFAMHAAVVRHYLNGGNYPIGTSRVIGETASDNLESMGGELYVNAGVDEIIINKNKAIGVRLENKDEIYAPIIISSTGVLNTYNCLLRNSKRNKQYKEMIKKVYPTSSYLCLYIGLKIASSDLMKNNTNLWIYPGYDHDTNVKNYISNNNVEFPVIYISFPSAKDPEYQKKYPHNSTMEVIVPSPFHDFEKWQNQLWKKRGTDYDNLKENISQRILKEVYKYVPKAKKTIDYYELSTPLSVKSLANYKIGEMYGIEHGPSRFHNKWLRPQTEIKNLFLTGQDIITVGVTSALFSGLLTVSSILKKNLIKEILKN